MSNCVNTFSHVVSFHARWMIVLIFQFSRWGGEPGITTVVSTSIVSACACAGGRRRPFLKASSSLNWLDGFLMSCISWNHHRKLVSYSWSELLRLMFVLHGCDGSRCEVVVPLFLMLLMIVLTGSLRFWITMFWFANIVTTIQTGHLPHGPAEG